MKVHLVGIDWQNDFCSQQNGSLFVGGTDGSGQSAEEDAVRCATMIDRLGSKLDDIHMTMDSHRLLDIAHPMYWIDSKGDHPSPFTIITKNDVMNGTWMTTIPYLRQRGKDYVTSLEDNKRYPLCIWPPHCLIGTEGHNFVPVVSEACQKWEKENIAMVDIVTKGSNPFTEHYSAIQADVPDAEDPTTMLDLSEGSLIDILSKVDLVALTGQALSHCLANTVRDIANNFGEENIKKLVLITDCTSSVTDLPGSTMFADMASEFISEMTSRGMQTSTSTDFLA